MYCVGSAIVVTLMFGVCLAELFRPA
jgi:hypothetical protein